MSEIDVNQVLSQMRALRAASQGQSPAEGAAPGERPDFAALLKQSVDHVNQVQKTAGDLSERFVAGDPAVDVTEVMVAVQKAGLSFEAMKQVRNKLVKAYQEIMSMQV